MTEQSERIKTTFENMKRIYTATSTMLMDVEGYMEKAGYNCLHGNYIGTEQSKHINAPSSWYPPYLSRFMSNLEEPATIKAFGVYFHDEDKNIIDPVVLIGFFNMKTNDNGEPLLYNYWFLKHAWFSLISDKKYGEIIEFGEKGNFSSGKLIAYSLDDIQDQESLKEKIVEPLIALNIDTNS